MYTHVAVEVRMFRRTHPRKAGDGRRPRRNSDLRDRKGQQDARAVADRVDVHQEHSIDMCARMRCYASHLISVLSDLF